MASLERAFIRAAKQGDLHALAELLAADAGLLDAADKDGSTALHCAAWKGHDAAVALLLEAGADVGRHNNNDHWGTTPLHAAAHANNTAVVRRLIAAGADVNARDMNGLTPLGHTAFHRATAAARILTENGAGH